MAPIDPDKGYTYRYQGYVPATGSTMQQPAAPRYVPATGSTMRQRQRPRINARARAGINERETLEDRRRILDPYPTYGLVEPGIPPAQYGGFPAYTYRPPVPPVYGSAEWARQQYGYTPYTNTPPPGATRTTMPDRYFGARSRINQWPGVGYIPSAWTPAEYQLYMARIYRNRPEYQQPTPPPPYGSYGYGGGYGGYDKRRSGGGGGGGSGRSYGGGGYGYPDYNDPARFPYLANLPRWAQQMMVFRYGE